MSDLSDVLEDVGDTAGARFYVECALALDQTVYGPHHPTIVSDIESLGRLQSQAQAVSYARP